MFSAVLLIGVAVVTAALGSAVFFRSNRQHINRHFFYLALGITGWIISNAVFAQDIDDQTKLIVGLVSYGFAACLALNFFLFCHDLSVKRHNRRVLLLAKVAGMLTIVISMIPGVIAYGVSDLSIKTHTMMLLVYGVVLLLLFGAGLWLLVRSALTARSKSERSRIAVVLVGLFVAVIIGMTCNLILPLFNNYAFVQFGPLGSLALVGACAYAIVKHGLFDIKLAAVRSVAYVLSLFALAATYYLAAYLISVTIFQGQVNNTFSTSPLNIFLALILAFIFQPIKRFFDKVTDNVFFRDLYNSEDFYGRLSEILTTTTADMRGLLQRISGEISTTLKAERAFFYVQWNHTHHLSAGTKGHRALPSQDAQILNEYVMKSASNDVIVAELLPDHDEIRRLLVSHKIALAVPLIQNKTILGYFFLGEQKSGGYTTRDIRVLDTISNELVIAIRNALSVQEVKDINIHLQQRIDTATSELRRTNARLRRLDTTKDEFLSMASHQLRTPLTSIKGYLSMVIDGDLGRVSATQKKVLEEAFTSSERMVHLIHDFLNVSRLQTGRFVLELGEGDLSSLVKGEVDSLRRVAESRNMTIRYQDDAGSVPLMLDDTKLRQVVMNYIDNAIYYSKPDTTITVELLKQDGNVVLKVHDTGIGVPPSEQSQLFEKFFRATNARKQRPDGTGVGLYLAKKVITAHGGDVLFSSKVGKGSMFGFKLPLVQDQALLEKNSTKQL